MKKKSTKVKLEISIDEDNPKKDLIYKKIAELLDALKEAN